MTLFNMTSKDEIELSSRAAAKATYVGEHTAICRVLEHYKMFVDTRDIGITPHLMLDGFWESWVTYAMARMITRGMHVVNVGANMGYYAVLFADLVGNQGSVLACEPNKNMFAMLTKNRAINGFAHLSPMAMAVSDRAERRRLAWKADDFGGGHLVQPGETEHETEVGEDVTTVRLDDLGLTKVDLVFMDVEGHEPEVWAGMRELRRTNPQLITVLEFAPARYADAEKFATALTEGGARLAVITEASGELAPRSPAQVANGENLGGQSCWEAELSMVVVSPP